MINKKPSLLLTGWQQFFIVLLRIGIGWHFLREGWVKYTHPTFTAKPYLTGSWGPLAPIFNTIAKLTWVDTPIVNWIFHLKNAQDPTQIPAWAKTAWMLKCADFSMPWLLMIAGAGMMLGLLTRTSIVIALCLLVMFYVATPPIDFAPVAPQVLPETSGFYQPPSDWAAFKFSIDHAQWAGKHQLNTEGNFYIVNKNLVEMLALLALLSLDTGLMAGLDVYLRRWLGAIKGLFRKKEKPARPVAPQAQTVQS